MVPQELPWCRRQGGNMEPSGRRGAGLDLRTSNAPRSGALVWGRKGGETLGLL